MAGRRLELVEDVRRPVRREEDVAGLLLVELRRDRVDRLEGDVLGLVVRRVEADFELVDREDADLGEDVRVGGEGRDEVRDGRGLEDVDEARRRRERVVARVRQPEDEDRAQRPLDVDQLRVSARAATFLMFE